MEDDLKKEQKVLEPLGDWQEWLNKIISPVDSENIIGEIKTHIRLDYKAMMWKICAMWIEECAAEDRYPFDVLIPVPFSDIKDSEREGYMEIIMEKFRKEKKKNKG